MSRERNVAIRQPLTVKDESHRHVEERVGLRIPAAVPFLARLVWRLPRRSRLRRGLIRRALRFTYEAANRGDHEAQVLLYHPDGETIPPSGVVGLGWRTTRGREERMRFQHEWQAEWGDFRFEPEYMVDLGDRLFVAGRVNASGLSSGVQLSDQWAEIFTIVNGLAIREEVFFEHAEALEAAGLAEAQ